MLVLAPAGGVVCYVLEVARRGHAARCFASTFVRSARQDLAIFRPSRHQALRGATIPHQRFPPHMDTPLRDRIATSAFAFRGYNVKNIGRSTELLQHHAYGPVVEEHLRRASELCSDTVHAKVDLVSRVRRNEDTDLETFADAIGLIISMELVQLRLLEQFFDINWRKSQLAFGYSLGEVAALIATDVFQMESILPPPLAMAHECVELARDATMGVLFTRARELDLDAVRLTCLEINYEARGVMGISSYLAPNSVLLLGQYDTLDRFQARFRQRFPHPTHLRRNNDKWPPLHTPLLWERNIPNRAAVMMHTMPGGFTRPTPTILSCVTGRADYNEHNSREILNRWIDHPQRLWDVVCGTLASGVETVVHVGPVPNLLPATFKRVSDNVRTQLSGGGLNGFGRRAIAGIARRPWLQRMLSQRAALLRAPFVEHLILEDWLLEQEVP